ncbi:MAG: alpha/beta hydrolase [Gammaproteobacteria bacterium]|jgi:pimeloyl-ACP methyl ester carboxylesterase|nr:alpha/beta hydrolase [Gammaproteobacteria bacterium]MBT4493571.1 alpha/beta hydrolase [Gammaproteobacteria bacterium]MBT7371602.1 alpha/beta hydrolase [Gammaproteobacteria bacterium]
MTTEGSKASPASRIYFSQRLRLHYLDWGNADKPPLLLVHGNRDHCHNWDWIAEELREDYHIIAPDFRGHGDSAWVYGSSYSHNEYVYDLAQLIHQQNLAPLTMIAHSLGGSVALKYAGIYPENIEKMVVIEGTGGAPAEWEKRPPHERMRDWIENTRKVAGRMPMRYESLEDSYRRMHDANSHLREDQARHLTVHGANQNEDGSYSWKFDNYTHCMAAYDMPRAQVRELWGRIDAPVLLVSGSESWFSDESREDPLPYFKNARHARIEDAGHWLHHDQLDEFLQITRAFLAE